MKSSFQRAICGALSLLWCSGSQADVVPLAITAPLPAISVPTPSLPAISVSLAQVTRQAAATDSVDLKSISAQANVSAFGLRCTPSLEIMPSTDASMRILLSSPCRPDETVTFQHAGLSFDVILPVTGEVSFQMPSLEKQANVAVKFADGGVLSGSTLLPEIGAFMRVALQSDGNAQLHLKTDAPKSLRISRALLGDGTGQTVQLISHHKDPDTNSGVIRLSLEAQISPTDCNQMRSGQVVHMTPDLPPLRYGLSLAPPGCDRVGEILELKNILQDMKLASQ